MNSKNEKNENCKICKKIITPDDKCSVYLDGFACLICSKKLQYLRSII